MILIFISVSLVCPLQRDYPSALEAFEKLIERVKDKKIAMFLDYDGTLSPIVDDPDSAFMSEHVSIFVLPCHCHVNIIG